MHDLEIIDKYYVSGKNIDVETSDSIDDIKVTRILPKEKKERIDIELPKEPVKKKLTIKELNDIIKNNDGRTSIVKEAKKELKKRK